ncbi:hypothetical protein LVD15_26350 [Fulvivirga maritima]|uniref:hypothetical protein n=1 Tax=Fulvivirga maritima TaxID=2904247 RepID=UPI001F2A9FBE|nr:hypothetical protein [Fulvivirga maritima]UII26773.1 hypothetical protein LVD15_26350 [Fulvivirga maritima]
MRSYLLIFATILCAQVFGQDLSIYIDSVSVNRIKKNTNPDIVNIHENGPYVEMKVVICNKSGETITISPVSASYYLSYNFEGEKHEKELFPLGFMDNKMVDIRPHQEVRFSVKDDIFYGTPIFSVSKEDYTTEIIKALPTLGFTYKQKGIKVLTNEIRNVIIAPE